MSPKRKKVENALKNLFSSTEESKPKNNPLAIKPEEIPESPDQKKEPVQQKIPRKRTGSNRSSAVKSEEVKNPLPVKEEKTPVSEEILQAEQADTTTIIEKEVETAVKEKEEPVGSLTEKPAITSSDNNQNQPKQAVTNETNKYAGIEKQLVVFTLDNELFAIEISMVESIIKIQDYTVVPNVPDYIVGVTNLRGYVLPVIDLRKRFHLPETEHTINTRIIVLLIGSEKVGVIVDEVNEVARVSTELIEPTPAIVSTVQMEFVSGIAKLVSEDGTQTRMAILLEMSRALTGQGLNRN